MRKNVFYIKFGISTSGFSILVCIRFTGTRCFVLTHRDSHSLSLRWAGTLILFISSPKVSRRQKLQRIWLRLLPGETLTARVQQIFALLTPRLGSCSQSLLAHSERSGLPSAPQPGDQSEGQCSTDSASAHSDSAPGLSCSSRSDLVFPAPALLPFSIPVLIIGSLFCPQTPVLFSLVLSGETVPESWSQDKDFPVLAQFCFVLNV